MCEFWYFTILFFHIRHIVSKNVLAHKLPSVRWSLEKKLQIMCVRASGSKCLAQPQAAVNLDCKQLHPYTHSTLLLLGTFLLSLKKTLFICSLIIAPSVDHETHQQHRHRRKHYLSSLVLSVHVSFARQQQQQRKLYILTGWRSEEISHFFAVVAPVHWKSCMYES